MRKKKKQEVIEQKKLSGDLINKAREEFPSQGRSESKTTCDEQGYKLASAKNTRYKTSHGNQSTDTKNDNAIFNKAKLGKELGTSIELTQAQSKRLRIAWNSGVDINMSKSAMNSLREMAQYLTDPAGKKIIRSNQVSKI